MAAAPTLVSAASTPSLPPADAALARAQATSTHRQGNFLITTRKLPISKAGPIDAMTAALGIPIPEMIFGDNVVAVRHVPSGWAIGFNAYDALDAVDKTDKHMLQVAYARAWSASREQTSAGIKEVVKPYDWSYSTTYRGTVEPGAQKQATGSDGGADDGDGTGHGTENGTRKKKKKKGAFTPTRTPIPLELLKRRDPILFFDDVMLYESELDDNGTSVFSAKVRVHEARMLLLCRLYMRLDNVVVRVRDTRIYVDFVTEEVTREYTVKEGEFGEVKRKLLMTGLMPDGVTVALRDANKVAELLPTIEQTLESVSLKS
ncbi:TIP41-like family-domain-containing protein [Whalleya microplaca]|nr:TIP41-like family-domain-containing protein [Whalleya microplaca]